MNPWYLLLPLLGGWMVQIWMTAKQTKAWSAELRRIRSVGSTAVGKAGRRYRGGVVFVCIAVAEDRVVGAFVLRGFTTFARPTPLEALVGVPLEAVAGDGPLEGLTDNERAAAREAAGMLRAALTTGPGATSTAGSGVGLSTTGAATPV